MGIGAYRHFVTLEHPAVELEPNTWYCALQSAATQVIDGQAAYFVRGRYHPGLTLETQIHFEGRTFQVQGITDLDERHVDVQLLCVEVVGRGSAPAGPPVTGAPVITAPPVGQTITSGASVTLTVVASGTPPLTYQWLKNGAPIAGATNQFYVTGPVTVTTSYAVTVTNDYGAVTSAAATVAIPLTYQSQVLADGASNYWPLDDTSGPTARNLAMANPGTITGGVTLNQPGVGASKAMDFNGVAGTKITVPTLPSLLPAFTHEGWIYLRNLATATHGWMSRTSGRVFNEQLSAGGNITLNLPGIINFTDPFAVAALTWMHLVIVWDGGTGTIYVNGVMRHTGAFSIPTDTGSGEGTLGSGDSFGTPQPWDGLLQDIAIYSRALTPAEITAHYTLGAAR